MSFDEEFPHKCEICGIIGNWKPSMTLTGDPPIDIEWRCNDCFKAVADARAQKRYLITLKENK
jgi:hypothetical protein